MLRRATASPIAGLALMGLGLLAVGAMPALAVEPRNAGPIAAQRPLPQAGQTVSVAAIDDEFRPTSLTVTAGTTVVWTNQGQNPHTVTASDRAFDSGTLEPGQTFSVTFDEAGQVPYYCQIHGEPGSGMTGVVIVQAAPAEGGDEGPPASGSGGLAATGFDPIPLAFAVLALAAVGLTALLAGRKALEGRR
jgi:plastocyanin